MHFIQWLKSFFTKKASKANYLSPSAFVHTWPLMDFARKHGKMQLGKFPDTDNIVSRQKCRFVHSNGSITYVIIPSVFQGITSKEISEQKDRIRVGELPNGKFVLYDFRWKDWENVDL